MTTVMADGLTASSDMGSSEMEAAEVQRRHASRRRAGQVGWPLLAIGLVLGRARPSEPHRALFVGFALLGEFSETVAAWSAEC